MRATPMRFDLQRLGLATAIAANIAGSAASAQAQSYQQNRPSNSYQTSQPRVAQPAAATQPSQPSRAANPEACTERTTQPDASIASCNQAIRDITKNLAAAYFYRGAAYVAKSDFDRAIADYNHAIAIDPTESDYLNSRAAAYEQKNDITRAMADYDKAIQINPKSAYAYNNRGATFQRKGDYARASADYGHVTRLQPDNADAWAARCWVRAAGGREVQQALADCNQALKINADLPDALDTRGFVHLRLGKYDDAIKDYDAALKLDPKNPGALYARGMAKIKKGDRTGGGSDVSAAKSMKSDIADDFSRHGIR
jgi:tetratricopeptide (TPR) repeat protein